MVLAGADRRRLQKAGLELVPQNRGQMGRVIPTVSAHGVSQNGHIGMAEVAAAGDPAVRLRISRLPPMGRGFCGSAGPEVFTRSMPSIHRIARPRLRQASRRSAPSRRSMGKPCGSSLSHAAIFIFPYVFAYYNAPDKGGKTCLGMWYFQKSHDVSPKSVLFWALTP